MIYFGAPKTLKKFIHLWFLISCEFLLAPPAPNLMCLVQRGAKLSICFCRFSWRQSLCFVACASGAKLDVSGAALRWALNVFFQVALLPNYFVCWLAPPPPNSMLEKLTLALRVWFLDVSRIFAGASGAKLDVSGAALRWALNVFLQLVPNSIYFC